MKLKNKQTIEGLLESGDLEQVIDELKNQVKLQPKLHSDALALSAQWKKYKADKMERLISYEQENLMLNNLRRSVIDFIEKIEKYSPASEAKAEKPIAKPASTAKMKVEKRGIAWWWLALIPAGGLAIWLLLFNKKEPIPISICTLNTMSISGHCCNQDLPRISLNESAGVFYASTVITGDPIVQAALFLENGSLFPTQPINFQYDITQGDVCHSAMIALDPGKSWYTGRYTLKILLNNELAAEKTFEIIQ